METIIILQSVQKNCVTETIIHLIFNENVQRNYCSSMRTYKLIVDDWAVGLIQTALGEMAWQGRNTPAGQNYKELSKNIKEQIKAQ